jgi:hypothetical protein
MEDFTSVATWLQVSRNALTDRVRIGQADRVFGSGGMTSASSVA